MHPKLAGVWSQMRSLGLGALSHANHHAGMAAMENAKWPDLSVLQAGHAAELLVKARIAQENPLLIFSKIPEPTDPTQLLDFEQLFSGGQTLQWNELPRQLWAATGMSVDKTQWLEFGRFRNAIQHFAPPQEEDPADKTLEFVFRVIDPFINSAWGLCALDYHEDYEPYLYFVTSVVGRKLPFNISREAAECFSDWAVDWKEVDAEYRQQIEIKVKFLLNKISEP